MAKGLRRKHPAGFKRELHCHRCPENSPRALDMTYPLMARGFVYLTAVVDRASRKVVAARIAITLVACHAVDVLQQAFNRHGIPGIITADQGSQFTADEFVQAVKDTGCRLSMDGRGAWGTMFSMNPYGSR